MNNISWTPNAKEAYLSTLEFLMNNYKVEVALQFDNKVEQLIQNITRHIFFCPTSSIFKGLRRCTVSKYNSLVYSIHKNSVTIVAFYDNRSGLRF